MRPVQFVLLATFVSCLAGCGYHTPGSAAHLPSTVHTLDIPIFQNHAQSFHTEVVMTQAVIREFTSRTSWKVLSADAPPDADATLRGTVLTETVTPLTYNSGTGQSSSFLVTVHTKVVVTDRNNAVLYQNPDYVFRHQYETTADLSSFIQEDPAAIRRLSQDFAQSLVSDILESF
ncbi:MAG TPA: LPS assembly lipoprotein LptE [Acidisarcina sp.]|nr:LPS assembly lipoprotein LptE [Acidisarcina sp.]